ncbi:MAG: thioredoxin family protein [Oricola sp.]|jgi:thiol-disulfide isomerase/thioredoxin|nr:thioredoxin family protein [Oricola sp.]
MMFKILCALALTMVAACAAVKTTAGVAGGATKMAVKTTAGATGAAADAAFSGGDEDKKHEELRPFDASRNAKIDVEAAFASARVTGRNVLLVLGGNWCHDSRGLAAAFERPELAEIIADGYELVWVDVGRRDRNLDIAAEFGVMEIFGTPTVLIASPDGALLNRESVHDWRTAASEPYDETLAYFRRYAG